MKTGMMELNQAEMEKVNGGALARVDAKRPDIGTHERFNNLIDKIWKMADAFRTGLLAKEKQPAENKNEIRKDYKASSR